MLDDVPCEWSRGEYRITTDRREIVPLLGAVLEMIRQEHWGGQLTLDVLERGTAQSISLAVLEGPRLVGFARTITDLATFAYVSDVVIADGLRGRGLGTWLVECLLAHPDLQGLRRVALLTRDAPALYERAGFTHGPPEGRFYMERRSPR